MRTETFTATNLDEFAPYAEPLTKIYKDSFKRPPWNEGSQCLNDECTPGYRAEDAGVCCPDCDVPLTDAYDAGMLIDKWTTILGQEDGYLELEIDDDNQPLRATLARPTTANELFVRKYSTVPEMEPWLKNALPYTFVWIEDTFSDLEKRPSGNLAQRRRTIMGISKNYQGLNIATRTLAEAIVAATVRDFPRNLKVYVGSEEVGQDFTQKDLRVPDRRTLLLIGRLTRGVIPRGS